MKQRYNILDGSVFERAVKDCLNGKWERNDVLTFVEKYTGIPRHEILLEELDAKEGTVHKSARTEAITSLSAVLEETVSEILRGKDPEIDEPRVRLRKDGMTGKLREIALLSVTHQMIGHVAYILMEPMLKAKLYPTQHASIPGRGQTRLKDQVNKYLRKKSLGIAYAGKTDCEKAYASTSYEKVTELVKEDIPDAMEAITLLEYLGRIAPGGHLIIGGYIDAWLFNYVMARAMREAYKCGTTRRGKFRRAAIRIVTFMDDALILAASKKALKMAEDALARFLETRMGIRTKKTAGAIRLLAYAEEKRRKEELRKAKRGCCPVDMGGFKIYRTHISIRRRVFIRARRAFIRGWKDIRNTGRMCIERAYAITSYYSFVAQTDSFTIRRKYKIDRLKRIAGRTISRYQRNRNREKQEALYDLRERIRKYEAGIDDNRKTAGYPDPRRPHKGRGRNRGGWTAPVAV